MSLRLPKLLLAASLLAAPAANAQSVLYFTDENVGTSVLPSALALVQGWRPGMTTTTATDLADFYTKLGAGSWSLVIFGQQNQSSPFQLAPFATYLAAGGRVLGANWTSSGDFDDFMGIADVSENGFEISGAGALFVGTTSPISITDPGWGTFSRGYTGEQQCLATLSSGGCAAAIDNGGATMMLAGLFDTYTTADGERFVANAADYMLGAQTTVPEPSTYALMAAGLAGIFAARRRRKA